MQTSDQKVWMIKGTHSTWVFDKRPPRYFRLDGHQPVACKTYDEWIDGLHALGDIHLAYEEVGGAAVSTIFLGIDLALPGGSQQLFETVILHGCEPFQVRCATWDEAMHTHAVALDLVHLWTEKD
jgi:hypothetical protein